MQKKHLRLFILVGMLFVVVGIWFAGQASINQEPSNNYAELPDIHADNPDFALHANAIDLEALKAHKLPIIIDFGADSCIPCKAMAPVLIDCNYRYSGKAIIKFVDVWKNSNASTGFPVQIIPTQIFYNADGTAYVPSDDIAKDIKFMMYEHKETGEHIYTTHQGGLNAEQMDRILEDMGAK